MHTYIFPFWGMLSYVFAWLGSRLLDIFSTGPSFTMTFRSYHYKEWTGRKSSFGMIEMGTSMNEMPALCCANCIFVWVYTHQKKSLRFLSCVNFIFIKLFLSYSLSWNSRTAKRNTNSWTLVREHASALMISLSPLYSCCYEESGRETTEAAKTTQPERKRDKSRGLPDDAFPNSLSN